MTATFLFSKDKQRVTTCYIFCVPLILFLTLVMNFMGVDLMVLRNMFPPSQLQKRQCKTTEGQAKSKAIPLHSGCWKTLHLPNSNITLWWSLAEGLQAIHLAIRTCIQHNHHDIWTNWQNKLQEVELPGRENLGIVEYLDKIIKLVPCDQA